MLCVVCTTHKGLQGTLISLKALLVHTKHSFSVVVMAFKELSSTNQSKETPPGHSFSVLVIAFKELSRQIDRKKPPPRGGFSIYYVP